MPVWAERSAQMFGVSHTADYCNWADVSFQVFLGQCMWQLWKNFKGWWCATSNVSYSRISHKRPPEMQRLGVRLRGVFAYEGRTARAKCLGQPRMGWYIYSKKIMKVPFPYQLLVVLLTQSWRYKFVVKKFYLYTWLLCRNVPETSDEQILNFLNWNLEIWVFFSRVMVNIVVIDRIKKHSNSCVGNNDSQRINSLLSIFYRDVLHCLVRPCVKWSLTGSAEKVVTVAYRGGRLREVSV